MRQLAAALAAVGIGLAATGCAVTTNGSPALAGHSGPLAAPPVAVEALDSSLLGTAEINTAMAATEMTVHTSRQNMWDDSPGVADMNCLAVAATCANRPVVNGCENFHLMQLAAV